MLKNSKRESDTILAQEYEPNSPRKGELVFNVAENSYESTNTPNGRSGTTSHGDSPQVT